MRKKGSLRLRLILAFIVLIVLALMIGGIGIYGMRAIAAADQRLYVNYTLPLMNLEKICEGFQRIRVNLYRAGSVDSAEERKVDIAAIALFLESVDDNTRQYDSSILTAEGRRLFVAYATPLARFKAEVASALALAESGKLGLEYRRGLVRIGLEADAVQAKSIAAENGRISASSTLLAAAVFGSAIALTICLCVAILRFVMRSVGGEPAVIAKIGETLPGIRRTAELVQEISASCREQGSGVEQISKALTQLDAVIQQNAGSSEELASTAEELASQAEQLSETISYFKAKGPSV
jgi:hypothetical protein